MTYTLRKTAVTIPDELIASAAANSGILSFRESRNTSIVIRYALGIASGLTPTEAYAVATSVKKPGRQPGWRPRPAVADSELAEIAAAYRHSSIT
jgi:hypothetical protein